MTNSSNTSNTSRATATTCLRFATGNGPARVKPGRQTRQRTTSDLKPKLLPGNQINEKPVDSRSVPARRRDAGRGSIAEAREVQQAGGLPVCFLNPFDDVRWVRRIFELDGDGAVDLQFLDRLKIRLEFDDAAARGQVAVDFAVAIADVDMDGFAFEPGQINRAIVGQHKVANVDIGAHAWVGALVHETRHGDHTVEQAQPERLQLEGD